MDSDNKGKIIGGIIAAVIIVIIAIAVFSSPSGSGSSSSSSRTETCQSCGRTFSDDSNMKNIRFTNMCNNCYKNFKYATGQ